jgi:hypothetical protein
VVVLAGDQARKDRRHIGVFVASLLATTERWLAQHIRGSGNVARADYFERLCGVPYRPAQAPGRCRFRDTSGTPLLPVSALDRRKPHD